MRASPASPTISPPSGTTSNVWTRFSQAPGNIGAVGMLVGQRRAIAAGVPFLAADHAGVAADADVEVDDQAELLRRGLRRAAASFRPLLPVAQFVGPRARLAGRGDGRQNAAR